ncbi:MAG: tRNA1(Val) (adenine(37)-N6)-methyltransferase [Syntrophorhabdus sp. PtaB.Bin184]|jgi:tRNA1Val (adenine37-N6)-methyltransferase|nr:MAG: tRNA1(Val) (adenine(37)-N6)-methyltransferase [Syntrophorhabdus sp. PtaB.Bin184]
MRDIVGKDETLDILCNEELWIIQKRKGYRFSIDAILLAAFVLLKKHERLLDIGSGCGIIPIYIVKKGFRNEMIGVELQTDLHETAQKNSVINHCEDHVRFINADINTLLRDMRRTPFHVVVSNPPYTKLRSGRTCPERSRLLARYEETLDLETLVGAASSLLMKKGRFYVIYPARRAGELIHTAASRKLALKRLRAVHPRKDESANLVLAEFMKDGGVGAVIEKPLYVYDGDAISAEVKEYYSFGD